MGSPEFWKTILNLLGPGAATLVFIAVMNGALKMHENKKQKLQQAQDVKTAQDHASAMRDADWNALFRHAAEQHLPWDNLMLTTVRRHEDAINDLRRTAGLEPINFPQIPSPPPLFPRWGDD